MALGFRGFNRGASSVPKTLVTYNVDTGTSYQEKVNKGKSVLSPTSFTPTKTGYTFLGWREDTQPLSNVLVTKTAEGKTMTLYAVFYKVITLSYNGNGSTSGSTASQTGNRYWNNSYVSNPLFTVSANGFAKTSYTFYKWHLNSTSGTAYKPNSTITLDTNATMYAEWLVTSTTFNYTGAMQSFSPKSDIIYRIQLYGAQGGGNLGGAGGYTIGYRQGTEATWYIGVGGRNATFNGGGSGAVTDYGGHGGGATHIAITNTTMPNTNATYYLIGVAGGGGGGFSGGSVGGTAAGGTGGGTNGGNGTGASTQTGGTQSTGGTNGEGISNLNGSYGQGGTSYVGGYNGTYCAGGGGGYYGGAGSNAWGGGGGGGSGNTVRLSSASMSNGQKTGNGQAIITIYSIS